MSRESVKRFEKGVQKLIREDGDHCSVCRRPFAQSSGRSSISSTQSVKGPVGLRVDRVLTHTQNQTFPTGALSQVRT